MRCFAICQEGVVRGWTLTNNTRQGRWRRHNKSYGPLCTPSLKNDGPMQHHTNPPSSVFHWPLFLLFYYVPVCWQRIQPSHVQTTPCNKGHSLYQRTIT